MHRTVFFFSLNFKLLPHLSPEGGRDYFEGELRCRVDPVGEEEAGGHGQGGRDQGGA